MHIFRLRSTSRLQSIRICLFVVHKNKHRSFGLYNRIECYSLWSCTMYGAICRTQFAQRIQADGIVKTTTGSSTYSSHWMQWMNPNSNSRCPRCMYIVHTHSIGACSLHLCVILSMARACVSFNFHLNLQRILDNQIQLPVETCVYNLKCMFYVSKLNICITSFWMYLYECECDADAAVPLYALYGKRERGGGARETTVWIQLQLDICELCNDLWHTAAAPHNPSIHPLSAHLFAFCECTSNLYLWNMNMWLTRTLNHYYCY